MDYFWFMLIFSLWYTFSLVVSEKVGKKKDIGEEWSFFLCMMLTPVIGYGISVLYKKAKA
jgi:hypothetical protein